MNEMEPGTGCWTLWSLSLHSLLVAETALLACCVLVLGVLDVGGDLVQADLLGDTLATGEVFGTGGVFEDLSSALCLYVFAYKVDLLQGETLELGKDEDRVQETDDTEAHEDDVCLVADVLDHTGESAWPLGVWWWRLTLV